MRRADLRGTDRKGKGDFPAPARVAVKATTTVPVRPRCTPWDCAMKSTATAS